MNILDLHYCKIDKKNMSIRTDCLNQIFYTNASVELRQDDVGVLFVTVYIEEKLSFNAWLKKSYKLDVYMIKEEYMFL